MDIVVLGGGSFGTAIANSLKRENEIFLFTRNATDVAIINSTRRNDKYFPNKVLSKQIRATNDLHQIRKADLIFICIPSHVITDFFRQIEINPHTLLVNGAKGFGEGVELIPQSLSKLVPNSICSLKGPSFADELIYELPTSFTLACKKKDDYDVISSAFRDDLIIFDYTQDIHGVELLSIMKNIYAIIIGIVDASFNSANVRFMLLTKAINEIKMVVELCSLPVDTLFKYGGIGDLGLTALNDLSRNRTLGLLIGKGFFGESISNTIVLEGVKSVDKVLEKLPQTSHYKLPLLIALSNLLKRQIDVSTFVKKVIHHK